MLIDHYTGFEGAGEITFQTLDKVYKLIIREGYFNTIIGEIPTNEYGCWEGLALFYHTHTGWYASSPFIVNELTVIIWQLEQLSNTNFRLDDTKTVYQDLLTFFIYCQRNGLEVAARYS